MQIHIKNLCKNFDGQEILKDMSLTIENTHALVIVGPSGSGKTTLIRCIAGLVAPDSGTVSMNGVTITYHEPQKLRHYRKRVGMVFQSYNLFPHLTALENIVLPLVKAHKKSAEEAHEIALAMLRRFKLENHMHKKPYQLSGGQKQRIALSRGIAISPDFLVLDEPTSALDPEFTVEVLEMIEELRKEDIHLVLVTHHMGFASKVADYVCFLDEGSLIAQGSPDRIFSSGVHPSVDRFLEHVLKY